MRKSIAAEISAKPVEQLRRRYDELWSKALDRIQKGEVELDPVLQARMPDERRGLSVLARPSAGVRQRIDRLLQDLRQLEPDQHYYHPAEFHVTVLSLFTATADFEPFLARKEKYVAAVDAALEGIEPIQLRFEGVTASPGTVMIQGFFETDRLNALRDRLRRQLRDEGLGEGVDQRYVLRTAHMTVIRFRAALRQSERFARALQAARTISFGTTTIQRFTLTQNDWYMSRSAIQVVKQYRCCSSS